LTLDEKRWVERAQEARSREINEEKGRRREKAAETLY
jgi:hypothetical protein